MVRLNQRCLVIFVTACKLLVSNTSGRLLDYSDMMSLLLVRCVHSRPAYFAEKLYNSMKGVGTDDTTLIRVIVSRCEVTPLHHLAMCYILNLILH